MSDGALLRLLRRAPADTHGALCSSVNNALTAFPAARKRQLLLHTPIIMAVWPQARLVQEEASLMTYGEVYEHNCARCHRDVDKPILFFKERVHAPVPEDTAPRAPPSLCAAGGTFAMPDLCTKPRPVCAVTSEQVRERQLKAFLDILSDKPMVSEQIFAQTMFKSLPSSNHTFTFRKQFCAQLALTSLFSYLLNCAAAPPQKILFAKGSGLMFLSDITARYSVSDREARAKLQDLPYRCAPRAPIWSVTRQRRTQALGAA